MNLFFLHSDPSICAQQHCDKHVVKMLLETTQILYTSFYINNCIHLLPDFAYRKASPAHPTVIWVSLCISNWNYALHLAINLSHEYTLRYKRVHSCDKHINFLKNIVPDFPEKKNPYKPTTKLAYFPGTTPVPLAMPEDSMRSTAILSYRSYYMIHKKHFAKWNYSPIPLWFTSIDIRSFFV